MFIVLFEVEPRAERFEEYLSLAGALRPELERIEGFIDNIRWRSLRRPGWLLSVSTWADEKALIRWRTHARHHLAQERGRESVFRDYHLRVGEVAADSHPPTGHAIRAQRLDETEAGVARLATITEGEAEAREPEPLARALGLAANRPEGLAEWDVFEAILTPGRFLLMQSWRDAAALPDVPPAQGVRQRRVRVIRDYGMEERREAPQYFPPAPASRR